MTKDECSRLNISLLLLEMIIDISDGKECEITDLAWAAHSYVQSVTLEAVLPDTEAQELYAKLQASHAIVEARNKAD
ncbi:hypothetical protein ABC383_25605 [Noviherbaspirillum sp. 1P10PC]|uniref:hypothetical protein n=1 Tax=Noviherbaspirillum sp. 1P10PC TaxID=3132292 RepID=UPI0039A0BDB8